jgi:hypothetical protein
MSKKKSNTNVTTVNTIFPTVGFQSSITPVNMAKGSAISAFGTTGSKIAAGFEIADAAVKFGYGVVAEHRKLQHTTKMNELTVQAQSIKVQGQEDKRMNEARIDELRLHALRFDQVLSEVRAETAEKFNNASLNITKISDKYDVLHKRAAEQMNLLITGLKAKMDLYKTFGGSDEEIQKTKQDFLATMAVIEKCIMDNSSKCEEELNQVYIPNANELNSTLNDRIASKMNGNQGRIIDSFAVKHLT